MANSFEQQYEEEATQIIKNPDEDFLKSLKKRLKANNGYCLNQPEKIPDNKCPCKYHRETGDCLCGLWIRY